MLQLEDRVIELLILKHLLEDIDYLKITTASFDKEYFDNVIIGEVVKLSGEYYQRYHNIPPIEYLNSNVTDKDVLESLLTEANENNFNFTDNHQYFLDATNNFLKSQAMKQAVIESVKIINNKEELIKIQDIINNALSKDLFPQKSNIEILGLKDFLIKERNPREMMLSPWLQEYQYIIITGE